MNKPSSGSFRVFRGGSWVYDPAFARVALRNYYSPGGRGNLGFRLVRTVSALELLIMENCHSSRFSSPLPHLAR